jgi:hypothetical protein
MEPSFFPHRQDAQPCESRDDTLASQHLGAQEAPGHLQEIGDVLGLRNYSGRVTMVLLLGSTEEDHVFAGHRVEVLSSFQRDGDGRTPLLIRPKDDVESFAQADDWLASGILQVPQEIQPRTCGVDHGPAGAILRPQITRKVAA